MEDGVMAASTTLRKTILTAITTRINTKFNSETGTVGKWFRKIERGILEPITNVRPALTVGDGGQQRASDRDSFVGTGSEFGQEYELKVLLTLQLAENWERVNPSDDWTDRIQTIIEDLSGWRPTACIDNLLYIADDPAFLSFQAGSFEAAWEIEFQARYVTDVVED